MTDFVCTNTPISLLSANSPFIAVETLFNWVGENITVDSYECDFTVNTHDNTYLQAVEVFDFFGEYDAYTYPVNRAIEPSPPFTWPVAGYTQTGVFILPIFDNAHPYIEVARRNCGPTLRLKIGLALYNLAFFPTRPLIVTITRLVAHCTVTGLIRCPGDGGGGGGGGTSPGSGDGLRGAIEVDSARAWLHVGSGKTVRTYHIQSGADAFVSPDYPIDAWADFSFDPRRGVLMLLAKSGASYVLYRSADGGLTGTNLMSFAANTGVICRDSERGLFYVIYGDGSDNVQRIASLDGGMTWGAAMPVKLLGSDGVTLNSLTGKVLNKTADARKGALELLVQIGGATKILESKDAGQTFTTLLG